MSFVYVLVSLKDNQRYIGSTIDLEQRLKEHAKGRVKSTKNRRPLRLYAYQSCESLIDDRLLEKKYKRSRGAFRRAIEKGLLSDSGV